MHHIRTEGFRRIVTADLDYMLSLGSGRAMSLLTVEGYRAGFAISVVFSFLASLLVLGVYVALLGRISPGMTLLSAALLGATGGLMSRATRHSKTLGEAISAGNEDLGVMLSERLRGIRLLKLSGTELQEAERIATISAQVRDATTRMIRIGAVIDSLLEPIVVLIACGMVFVAVEILRLPLAQIGLFVFVLVRLLPMLKELPKTRQSLLGFRASYRQVRALLETSGQARRITGGTVPLPARAPGVRYRDVEFTYPGAGEPALRRMTVTIPAGKVTALVGRSGAGKSTVVNLLARLYVPDSGSITLEGAPIETFDLRTLRRGMAFVSQDAVIFDETAEENIRYGQPSATRDDVVRAARLARADEFIRSLPKGYETKLGEGGVRLSGGERQRISLARALLQRAPILVLDEPVSAIDHETERGIHEGLTAVRRDGRTTLIVIAHQPSTIRLADEIVLMGEGRVIRQGTHQDLAQHEPWYAQMVGGSMEPSRGQDAVAPASAGMES